MYYWIINIGLVFFLCIFFAGILIPNILLIAFRKKLFDLPDERKIHHGMIPRLGGLAFNPAIFFSISLLLGLDFILGEPDILMQQGSNVPELLFGFCASTILYLVGIADDLIGVRYRTKFIIQILCGVILIAGGVWINNLYGICGFYGLSEWIGYPLTILVIVFVINSINLIDGIDGLASGLSGAALLFYGLIYIYLEQWLFAMLAFAALGALIPFFYYNVFGNVNHGKKIFMGDTGSLTIGIILCILSIKILNQPVDSAASFNPAVLAFAPLIIPCFDVMRVFISRIRMKKHPFMPDKSHIHHKLLAAGICQRAAMIIIISVSLIFTLYNIILSQYVDVSLLLIINIILWMLGNMWLAFKIKRRELKLSIVETDNNLKKQSIYKL